ncbi:hypothetical protein P0F65_04415 [Sphingomonas sp. I4]
MRTTLTELSGAGGEPLALADQVNARCGPDMCVTRLVRGDRTWRIAATRSGYPVPWARLIELCGKVDIVVADRRLPAACRPRWLKLDSGALRRTGGVSIRLDPPSVRMVRQPGMGIRGSPRPWGRGARV